MKKKHPLPLLCISLASTAMSADLHVAPDGNDSNPGSVAHPLASIVAARDVARKFSGKEPVNIIVADGTYYLPEPLVLTPQDSGTAEHPVTFQAQHEGKAILSGGLELKLRWSAYKDGIFQAKTPTGLTIDQLFVNGTRKHMARYPDYDPNKPTAAYQGFAADAFSKERAAEWKNPAGGYIHAMHKARWGGYHYRITGKKPDGSITYEGGWQNNRQMGMHPDFRMVENIFEELDAPGEWFHNAKNNTLYYMPEDGEEIDKLSTVVVRLAHLVEFKGSEQNPVKHITLKGFTFRHAARTFMLTKEPLLRSDWTIYRGGTILLTGTENISILDSEFDQVGGNGIFFSNYNRHGLVKGCHLHNLGASGVCFVGDPNAVRDPLFNYSHKKALDKISLESGPQSNNYPSLCTVEDSLIHGVGRVERQPAGVQISMASKITVRHTSIYDCARSGINVSEGTWGGHLIEGCDVFDTVLETHDHGSFNSWGRDRYWSRNNHKSLYPALANNPDLPFLDAIDTTVIRNSRWRCDHGWDIDLDDGSSNYEIYNNLMLSGGLKFREGFGRKAYNNILINSGFHPHVWYKNSRSSFQHNIVMAPHKPTRNEPDWPKLVDYNLYPNTSILQKCRSFGGDEHSVAGDPIFLNPKQGDFRVAENSPAHKIGFKNFPMNQFGVQKPKLKAIAKSPIIPTLGETRDKAGKNTVTYNEVWLGATVKGITGEDYSAFGTAKEDGGVQVLKLPPSSSAAKSGFKKNDLIQEINGNKVTNTTDLHATILAAGKNKLTATVVRDQRPLQLSITPTYHITVKTNAKATSNSSRTTKGTITATPKPNNEPVSNLLDGQIKKSYGPVFANGIHSGIYKLDLGSPKTITAITTHTAKVNGQRATQHFTLWGSNATSDPGYNLKKYSPIGTVNTSSVKNRNHTTSTLETSIPAGLGTYRWIIWETFPVSSKGEHSAFQEINVDTR